ncbi:hypothetical protein SAMN05421831_102193 [Allopseudospirillum japonicum]|uniref:Uncharacterized protein n=1 Tax=Allopseudospirillum japonicum TaxID=64971 RepID=A0A1H6R367_9GAMM|nr:TapY2 family type IVa secretion system protein [Allopseudospirillum japonicum]SEI46947.1 hypothetical protein SAMN05421831_102193 [Allopseudospirillum japonicum]
MRALVFFALTCMTNYAAAVDFTPLAEGEYTAYKCYVSASDGQNYVRFADMQDLETAKKSIQGLGIETDEGTQLMVLDFLECTEASKLFINPQARKLDEETPR